MRKQLAIAVILSALYHAGCKDSIIHSGNGSISFDLSQALVAYYPFDGNANDSSGQGNNGVNSGAIPSPNRFGEDGKAFSFNGSSAFIGCGDILDPVFSSSVAQFSISGWAKTSSTSSLGSGFIIGKNGGGSFGPYQWSVTHLTSQLIAQVFFDTAATNYSTVTAPMSSGRWFHFVLVFNGSLSATERLILYVDGQTFNVNEPSVTGTVGATTINSQQHLTIGATHDANMPQSSTNYYDGILDEIRVYARTLSAEEALALYVLWE